MSNRKVRHHERDKRVYVPFDKLDLFDDFGVACDGLRSQGIMKLISMFMSGELYDASGKQITNLIEEKE